MAVRSPSQLANRARIESLIRLVAPALDLVLAAGDRVRASRAATRSTRSRRAGACAPRSARRSAAAPTGPDARPGYDSAPRGPGGIRRPARLGGAAAPRRRDRGRDRRAADVRRHRLARADPLGSPVTRLHRVAGAGGGARADRLGEIAGRRAVRVPGRAHRGARRRKHRRGDRLHRARVGADLPRRRHPRSPEPVLQDHRVRRPDRLRVQGDLRRVVRIGPGDRGRRRARRPSHSRRRERREPERSHHIRLPGGPARDARTGGSCSCS